MSADLVCGKEKLCSISEWALYHTYMLLSILNVKSNASVNIKFTNCNLLYNAVSKVEVLTISEAAAKLKTINIGHCQTA